MKLRVVVKSKHVRKGVPNSPGECPIAIAVREQYNLRSTVVVNCKHLYFYDDGVGYPGRMRKFALNQKALDFMKRVDRKEGVGPIVLDLDEIT